MKLLMENGADPNVTNEKGHTPLITASGHGHPEVVALLVKYPKINLCAQVRIQIIRTIKIKV